MEPAIETGMTGLMRAGGAPRIYINWLEVIHRLLIWNKRCKAEEKLKRLSLWCGMPDGGRRPGKIGLLGFKMWELAKIVARRLAWNTLDVKTEQGIGRLDDIYVSHEEDL